MKKCPFDEATVYDEKGEEIYCEYLDDDTWECRLKECPYFTALSVKCCAKEVKP